MRVFIGYDPNEEAAFHVLAASIWRRSSKPVSITPLMLDQLPMSRVRHPLQSTEFSFSRFLVPHLSHYEGWSLFMDCDMLVRADITEIMESADPRYAVQVVKHDYIPKDSYKFLGNMQTTYEKKNWSSVMLFNNNRCRALTPNAVNRESGLWLHQFKWLKDENLIGPLDPAWNHLVGEYEHRGDVKNAHFTNGGPWFDEYHDTDYADEWRIEAEQMMNATISVKEKDYASNV